MVKVFVDTAAWIALINANDQLHQQAQTVMTKLRRQKARLVTTEFVLLEVADARYFCTCDDKLLRRARSFSDLRVRVISPLDLGSVKKQFLDGATESVG
jgi:predicted nucleic acid-binding protein